MMNSRFSHHFDENDSEWGRLAKPHFLSELIEDPFASEFEDPTPETEQLPFELFLPDRFEPKYRYPVLIWLHEDGANEGQLHEVMPAISDQNYIGIAFRGTSDDGTSAPGAFEWDCSEDKLASFAEEVIETLDELKRFLRIDENRVTLVGFDGGASMALQLMLHSPEKYSSAVAIGGDIPSGTGYGSQFRLLSSRRVLLGRGRLDPSMTHQKFIEAARDLDLSGLQVESRIYNSGPGLSASILRDIDHWLMSSCASAMV